MLFSYKYLASQFTNKHIFRDYDGDKKEYQLSRIKKTYNVVISDSGTYLDIWVVGKTNSMATVHTVLGKLGIVVKNGVVSQLPNGYTKCTLLDGEAIVHCTYDNLLQIASALGIRRKMYKNGDDSL